MSDFNVLSVDDCVKPKRLVTRFFIHCSASDNESPRLEGSYLAETIDQWHKQKGWNGIGYHYVIDKKGVLATGRSLEKIPAAQGGNNVNTLAVCCHGLVKERFTPSQLETLYQLCQHYDGLYDNRVTFHGHCEVSAKTCPVFDYKAVLMLDEVGHMQYLTDVTWV